MSETRFPNGIRGGNDTDLELKSDSDIVLYPADNIWISQGTKLIFEGTVPDDFEAKLQATTVTADRDIILPDASGTLALITDIPTDISELTDSTNIIPTDISELTDTTNIIPTDISELTDTTNIIPTDISELTDTTNIIPTTTGELTNDSNFITSTNNTLTLTPQSTEPASPTAGMLAVSNGTGWDPATDGVEHLNVYLNGVWIQIT